jgi:hypothetical protein
MNEAPKHSPGPWRWVDMMHHGYVILDSNNDIIATDIYACAPVDIELMCAAPTMLEALKIMTQWNVEWEEQRSLNDPLPNEIRDALAIIAKAEGTTNNQQTKGV